MPIFVLEEKTPFPPAQLASSGGLIAVGGDLSSERLLNAYANGIFPWYSDGEPILWWSPSPRMVLFPKELRVSQSMKKVLKKNVFKITADQKFLEVIEGCMAPRKTQEGTWITADMKTAYVNLYRLGFAHSLEVWQQGVLVGGLYGISLGRCFFGESMFSRVPNASKFAFIKLARTLDNLDFLMIDCQIPSPHLKTMGAREVPRTEFLKILKEGLSYPTKSGNWDEIILKG